MSRGYGRSTQGFLLADESTNALRIGDEPMQYHLNFPDTAVSVAEERMTGIPRLLQRRPDVEVVLLDDAYQHRSVKPGLNILITDFSRPFYKDHILPYGTLREARKAYRRADVIVVSKCPTGFTREAAENIRQQIAPYSHQQVFFSTIRYGQAYDFFTRDAVSLTDKYLVLVAGIAKPAPLVHWLKTAAADVHPLLYRDHHFFGSRDLEEIRTAFNSWDSGEKIIVTTEKDAARLHLFSEKLAEWDLPIAVLPIRADFLFDDGPTINSAVLNYIESERGENEFPEGSDGDEQISDPSN
jgi:tetraacyldisaccharide 4'-kinase